MAKKHSNHKKKEVTQRAEKPDELLMICVDKPVFGKRLASEFRKLQEQRNG